MRKERELAQGGLDQWNEFLERSRIEDKYRKLDEVGYRVVKAAGYPKDYYSDTQC